MYKLLGANVLYLDFVKDKLFYSKHNNIKLIGISGFLYSEKIKPLNNILKHFQNPDVIIIRKIDENNVGYKNPYPSHYDLNNIIDKQTYNSLYSLAKNITYKDEKFIQDSILLSNWNNNIINRGHSIAGITCEGERYVYNGWTRTTIDPNIVKKIEANNEELKIPCELMKFDWDVTNSSDFCLNHKQCILNTMNVNYHNLCFSFNKGSSEIIYIKDVKYNNSKKQSPNVKDNLVKSDKKCPEGKVLNPLTNRCILLKNLNKLPKNQSNHNVKPTKVCPEGKVLNPLTNRCNKIKNYKPVIL
jgi:hypothetical protein